MPYVSLYLKSSNNFYNAKDVKDEILRRIERLFIIKPEHNLIATGIC